MLVVVALEEQGVASPSVAWAVLRVRSRGETTRVVGSLVGIGRRRRRWSRRGTVLMALVAEEAGAICRESD